MSPVNTITDPANPETDADGINNLRVIRQGSNPHQAYNGIPSKVLGTRPTGAGIVNLSWDATGVALCENIGTSYADYNYNDYTDDLYSQRIDSSGTFFGAPRERQPTRRLRTSTSMRSSRTEKAVPSKSGRTTGVPTRLFS